MIDCIEANDGNFEQLALESDRPVLVNFWAPGADHAAHLRQLSGLWPSNMRKKARFVKLSVDDNPAVAQRYQIQAVPTLILFQAGERPDHRCRE